MNVCRRLLAFSGGGVGGKRLVNAVGGIIFEGVREGKRYRVAGYRKVWVICRAEGLRKIRSGEKVK